jgi:hypothetical protein
MRFSLISKAILGIMLVATGYLGALTLRTNLFGEDIYRDLFRSREVVEQAKHDNEAAVLVEREKPRFKGVIDGIFIAPKDFPVPPGSPTYKDFCGSLSTQSVPWDRAGELDATLVLPRGYELRKNDIGTGVVACGEMVLSANWNYSGPSPFPGETPSYIQVSRTTGSSTAEEIDVAVDRPTTTEIGGRQAVIIEPLTESGYRQPGYAWFHEPFGTTRVYTMSLSRGDFRKLLEAIASSTR